MTSEYISIKQASKILGVTPLTLRNWDKNGKFPATRHPINNYRVYKIDDLNKLVESFGQKQQNTPISKAQARKLIVTHLKD
ncbi:MAG: MerR family DNA-binding transcriptional regulator [Patescibacteria group bacterium]